MKLELIIWLCVCGIILITTLWLGIHYLDEWKEGLMRVAKFEADPSDSYYKKEAPEAIVQAKISLPIWIVSFIISFAFLIIIAIVLI